MKDIECIHAIETGQGWYDYEPDAEKVALAVELLRARGYKITHKMVETKDFNLMLHTLDAEGILSRLRK